VGVVNGNRAFAGVLPESLPWGELIHAQAQYFSGYLSIRRKTPKFAQHFNEHLSIRRKSAQLIDHFSEHLSSAPAHVL
jgi:hypothetical protein